MSTISRSFSPIQPTKLLTAQQERELALRIRAGDKAARDRLIEANLRLAAKIARRYHSTTLSADDVYQEASLALCRAVDSYDLDRGYRFSTWAWPVIRHHLDTLLRRSSRRSIPTVSLSEPIGEEESGDPLTLEDTIADPAQDTEAAALALIFAGELHDLIEAALTPRERCIISLRYGLEPESVPLGQHEVAPIVHLSRSRVQQLERQALRKLRETYLNQEKRIPGFRQLLLDLEAAA